MTPRVEAATGIVSAAAQQPGNGGSGKAVRKIQAMELPLDEGEGEGGAGKLIAPGWVIVRELDLGEPRVAPQRLAHQQRGAQEEG